MVLASAQPEGKVAIIAGVTPGLVKRIQAGKLVGAVAKIVGGSGGGKAEIAEAGGKDQAQIDAALEAAPKIRRAAGVVLFDPTSPNARDVGHPAAPNPAGELLA